MTAKNPAIRRPQIRTAGDEFQVGVTEILTCGDGEMDLGERFLVQDDLDALGDVESDDLGQYGARVGQQGFAVGGVGGDALSDDRFDLGASGNSHGDLQIADKQFVEYVSYVRETPPPCA
jgi:hypothetical protein